MLVHARKTTGCSNPGQGSREQERQQIQNTWSADERHRRRMLACERQARLLGLILRCDAPFDREEELVAVSVG